MERVEHDPELYRFYNCFYHPDEAMNRICIDQSCSDCTFVCPICIEQQHLGHRTEPLKAVMRKLKDQRSLVDVESSIQTFQLQIQKQKQYALLQITNARNHINEMLNKLTAKTILSFQELSKHMKTELEQYMTMNLRSREFKYDDKWQRSELISEFKSFFKVFRQNQSSFDKLNRQIKVRLNQAHMNLDALLGKLTDQTDLLFEEIMLTITTNRQQAEVFQWSSLDKHSDIKIKEKIAERAEQWAVGSPCILMDKAVNLMPPSVHQWMIKIVKMHGTIDIGICLENRIKKSGFRSTDREHTGHGNYSIQSTGYVANSQDRIINTAGRCFEFGAGDIITVRYDVCYRNISFNKNNREALFDMEVPAAIVADNYRPCVYLWKIGDTVEIIDKKQTR